MKTSGKKIIAKAGLVSAGLAGLCGSAYMLSQNPPFDYSEIRGDYADVVGTEEVYKLVREHDLVVKKLESDANNFASELKGDQKWINFNLDNYCDGRGYFSDYFKCKEFTSKYYGLQSLVEDHNKYLKDVADDKAMVENLKRESGYEDPEPSWVGSIALASTAVFLLAIAAGVFDDKKQIGKSQ